jgi:glycerate kinase
MRILICPQEFKGTLTAREAAAAMAYGAARAVPDAELDIVPLSDGGPGLQDVLIAATGGQVMTAMVEDPLARTVEAEWALLDDGSAAIEMAAAAGLWRVSEDERDPMIATTYGVGQLILAALDHGCRTIIVGLGGSATNDGGAGMSAALGARRLDTNGNVLPPGGAALARLDRIDVSGLDPRLDEATVIAATDVRNPLCGPDGASLVYGPQKGATADQALELDAGLRRWADVIERNMGIAVADVKGAGAAGGLGAGLIAFCGAEVRSGFEVIAEIVRLRQRIDGADLVITGEGRLDGQTGFGKTVAGAARLAQEYGTPVLAVPGALGEGWESILQLVDAVEPVVGAAATLEEALSHSAETLSTAVEAAIRGWLRLEKIKSEG